jgi:hypothetical protein
MAKFHRVENKLEICFLCNLRVVEYGTDSNIVQLEDVC